MIKITLNEGVFYTARAVTSPRAMIEHKQFLTPQKSFFGAPTVLPPVSDGSDCTAQILAAKTTSQISTALICYQISGELHFQGRGE